MSRNGQHAFDSRCRARPKADRDEELYASNIQVADFNCLNAALAVAKWKRMCGFYLDDHDEYETTFSVNLNQLSRLEQ